MVTSAPRQQTIAGIGEDQLQLYKLYRDRIVQEDNVINHRMTWMMVSEAFLLTGYLGLTWNSGAGKLCDSEACLAQV
jgi:hypothetical protein